MRKAILMIVVAGVIMVLVAGAIILIRGSVTSNGDEVAVRAGTPIAALQNTPDERMITVLDSWINGTSSGYTVVVDVEVRWLSSTPGYFSANDFGLKDDKGVGYHPYSGPATDTLLASKTLERGEYNRGLLAFNMKELPKSVTLYYTPGKGEEYKFEVNLK